jgi:RNA polymerase sigma-70 factor (ECF subfamily)
VRGSRESEWPRTREEERELVRLLVAGDAEAFDRFAERYLPGLFRFARRRLSDDAELARDVVQATACKAIEKLESFRGEGSLFTWLCACCKNEIAGHFRRLGRRPHEVPLDEGAEPGGVLVPFSRAEPGPEEALLELERADLVHAALDRLPAAYAHAVEWRYLEGATVPVIAGRLELSYKAAESLLSRARETFRAIYGELARGSATARDLLPGQGAGR